MGLELARIVRFAHSHVDGRFGGFVAALRRPSVPVQGITEGRPRGKAGPRCALGRAGGLLHVDNDIAAAELRDGHVLELGGAVTSGDSQCVIILTDA